MNKEKRNNDGFCVAPWLHMHFMPNSEVLPCCVWPYDKPVGNISKDSIYDIWNNDEYKAIRKSMLDGVLPKNCFNCKQKDEVGASSLRKHLNSFFPHHMDFIKRNTSEDGTIKEFKMSHLDVRFSNICNFKCRGCSPALSTAWYEDYQKLYSYQSEEAKFIQIFPNDRFQKELFDLLPTVERAYFAGGEPLIMREHYQILDELIRLNKTDIQLHYNSNASVLKFHDYDIIDYWSKFKKIFFSVSIDDIGKRGEYFRKGMDWKKTIENIKLVQEKCPHVAINVNITVNIMNVFNLPQIHQKLVSLKAIIPSMFNFNLLLDPEELSIQVLPKEMKVKVEANIQKYLNICKLVFVEDFQFLKHTFQYVLDFMHAKDHSHLMNKFIERTEKLDEIRKENFRETFGEFSHL